MGQSRWCRQSEARRAGIAVNPLEVVDRPFSSFRVGDSVSFEREITAEEVEHFAQLSGDRNPLHTDPAYAAATRYKRQVAHGLLVAAPVSTLAGHLLPGKRCVLLEVRFQFVHPVFPGEKLRYEATIQHVSAGTRVIQVKVQATNREGTVVLKGTYQGQVLPESREEVKAPR